MKEDKSITVETVTVKMLEVQLAKAKKALARMTKDRDLWQRWYRELKRLEVESCQIRDTKIASLEAQLAEAQAQKGDTEREYAELLEDIREEDIRAAKRYVIMTGSRDELRVQIRCAEAALARAKGGQT